MRFTVTAVVFPHKGGPSNGLRSVLNRRGGTKQGSLLRVCSHISDKENDYGSQISSKTVPNPLLSSTTRAVLKVLSFRYSKEAINGVEGFSPVSLLSSNCKGCIGNCASGIWLSTVLNIHTKDRFISHWSIWIKN